MYRSSSKYQNPKCSCVVIVFQSNTFQAVLITNGFNTFLMYNYPYGGIQWVIDADPWVSYTPNWKLEEEEYKNIYENCISSESEITINFVWR